MPIGWRVIEPPVEATIQAKTKKLGFNAQGQQPAMGPLYALLKKRTASFNGRVDPAGGIATTTKKTRMSAIGSQTHLGGMNVSVKKLKFTGTQINQGQMAPSVKKMIAAVNGRQTFQGALGAALKKAADSLTGAQTHAGTMAAAVKKAKAALVGTVPGIEVNAVGTYAFGGGGGPISPTITIAAGTNIRLYAIITVTHTNWLNSYNAGKPAASSNVNGAFTQVNGAFLGNASGYKQGSIWILEYIGPTVGAHTVTVDCSASKGLSGIQCQLIAFNGVGSRGTITQTTNPSDSTPTSLVASALSDGDMHLVVQTDNNSGNAFTGAWPSSPGLFVNQYQSGQAGDAKRCAAAYVKGDGASKTFSFTGSGRHATVHIPLIKA